MCLILEWNRTHGFTLFQDVASISIALVFISRAMKRTIILDDVSTLWLDQVDHE